MIRRLKNPIEVLSKDDIEAIHYSSLQVLDQTGLIFHSEEACMLLQLHGARRDGKRVYIPDSLVKKALKSCPPQFTLKARNPEYAVVVGGGSPALEATRGSVFIIDAVGRRRKATVNDFVDLTKLVQTSRVVNLNCGSITMPVDINQHAVPAFSMICSAIYTEKPLPGLTLNAEVARECLQLAALLYGGMEDNLVLGTVCPITPLSFGSSDLQAAYLYAQAGQPLCVTACGMAGTTAPPSLAGTLAVNNAEILAGLVLIQLIKEGTPVVYGNLSSITDMRHINMAVGAPEGTLLQLAGCQMARYYGLPFRGGGALNDAKAVDIQAGYETMMNLMFFLMAGFDYIPHAVGVVDSYMSIAYEKFILDEEMITALRRMMQGIEVSEETLLSSLVQKIGPGGNFFTTEEASHYFRRENWQPAIDLRQPYGLWKAAGAPDVPSRAMEVCRRRLDSYQKPALPQAVEQKLLEYYKDRYGQSEALQPA